MMFIHHLVLSFNILLLFHTTSATEIIIHNLTDHFLAACFRVGGLSETKGLCIESSPTRLVIKDSVEDKHILRAGKTPLLEYLQIGKHTFVKLSGKEEQRLTRSLPMDEVQDIPEEYLENIRKEHLRDEVKKVAKLSLSSLETVSRALGTRGIHGGQYKSSVPLHLITMNMRTLLEQEDQGVNYKSKLEKRGCPYSSTKCARKPACSDSCLGLCGYGCSCWRFLCGDCCWHKGCCQHDYSCRNSFFSFMCILPWEFSCDGYLYHYKC